MLTRGQIIILLEPKLSNIWMNSWKTWPTEYTAFTNSRTAKKATITDHKRGEFGTLVIKGEGNPITYTDPTGGREKSYTPVRFALGYKITQEAIDHELYGIVEKYERSLMKSALDHQEVVAANILNGAFGTTDADGYSSTGFDGLQLCSTAHTRLDGGANFRNRPSTDADLSLSSLQSAVTDFENLKDDNGRPCKIKPRLVIISPEDKFVARELLKSEYKPGTANNDVNAILEENLSFMVSHYKTDTDAWFLFGDEHDANFIWDVKPRQGMEEDFDSETIKRKVVQGFVCGHGEPRGIWGTSG